ncbi:MAG: helix-turn-helix domain-containing protein [Ruminococcus sp.]|uniref:helix-turn-helix domain-containing protein n=1 Tax=Ruminococcus sp. TaxID=41978 RepID=UPI0025D8BB4E|nr:helix-turn-helix domain-containing protein [Ruminococcus sp.]MCR5539748.1 helix-turn-helix domain-containing protein [Ruminococcus sp.]
MAENKTENKITMLTIKEAAALVDGLMEYRVRQMCRAEQIPCVKAGKKFLINKDVLFDYLRGDLK